MLNIIKRVYLSGPMTGLPDMNFPTFTAAAQGLRALGYEVINPVEINPDPAADRYECMRADIRAVTECDAVAVLPGWERSAGATREVETGLALGCVIAPVSKFIEGAHSKQLPLTWFTESPPCMNLALPQAMLPPGSPFNGPGSEHALSIPVSSLVNKEPAPFVPFPKFDGDNS